MIEISGAKVRLREFRPDDQDDSFAITGDDRVTTWLSFDSLTHEQAAERLKAALVRARESPRTEYYLAVTPLGQDRLVGFVRLGLSGVRAAKLGYSIAVAHWGNGYATDAARQLIHYGFTELGLHRITAAIGPDNAASIAVVNRLGFTHEGRLRDHVFTNSAWRDSILYSVLTTEWPRNSN